MKRHVLRIASVGLLLLAGCAARQKPGICFVDVTREARPILSPTDWFDLLLHGFDRKQGTVARPTVDCSGAPVVWQEPVADECREAGPEALPLPPAEHITDEDLIMATVRADLRLVWVIARRYSNGEALGPVGLVERTDDGIIVRALGSLRSFPRYATLRLEKSGDVDVLVAEGEQCTGEEPRVCRRFIRLLPMRHGRFFSESVTGQDGRCLGPNWFPLSREEVLALPNGLQRKVEMSSIFKFGPQGITQNEQVTMKDSDPKEPSLPGQQHWNSQAERMLRVEGNRLVGTHPSLWVRLVEKELQQGARLVTETPKKLAAPTVEPQPHKPAQATQSAP